MIETLTKKAIAIATATVCIAGMVTGCSSNKSAAQKPAKLMILSDRQCVPPPYASPRQVSVARQAPEMVAPATIAQDAFVPPAESDQRFTPVEPALDVPVFTPAGGVVSTEPAVADTPVATAPEKAVRTYTVTRGDSLSIIAYMYKISWQDLAAENNLDAKSVLRVGQKLRLPAGAAETPRSRPVIRRSAKTSAKTVVKSSSVKKTANSAPAATGDVHEVKPGDSLWSIARKYKVKEADVRALNPQIKDFSKIQVGDKIRIRGTAKSVAPASKVEAVKIPGQVAEEVPVVPVVEETIAEPEVEAPVAPVPPVVEEPAAVVVEPTAVPEAVPVTPALPVSPAAETEATPTP